MNKEMYVSEMTEIRTKISELENKRNELKASYINECKLCDVDELVEITRTNGTKITGLAKTFRILQDGDVYVDSLWVNTAKKVYFSQPYQSLKIVDKD